MREDAKSRAPKANIIWQNRFRSFRYIPSMIDSMCALTHGILKILTVPYAISSGVDESIF
jgi:hypothetical protein